MKKQLSAAVLIGVLVSGAMAQPATPGDKQPAGPATPTAPAAKPGVGGEKLAGPKVPDRTGKPTLVQRGIDGKVTRLDEWPALAAVRKLTLDEPTKAAVAKLEVEQAAAMDKMLSENLPEIAAIANAFQSGETAEGIAGIRQLKKDHPVLNERELLAQRIGEKLNKDQAHEVSIMVQEYWNALMEEAADAAKTPREKSGAAKVVRAEELRLLGLDVKASYERVIGQRVKDFDTLIKTLGLTAEQEGRVRKIVNDSFAAAKGNQAKMDKGDTFWKIWKELDARQRTVLIEQFKSRGK